jgi:DNA polymerase-3 subunit epsilon
MNLKLTRPIAFFDIETTGLNIVKDRIVEISILKVFADEHTELKTLRINPTIPIPKEVTKIHGITDHDVKNCPTFNNIAKNLADFFSNCDLAGYNSNRFDIPMLVEEFYRANVEFDIENRKMVDVQNIFHKMEQRTLIAAYNFFCNKELINAHSAEADISATYQILKAQIEKYKNVEYKDKNGNISYPIVNDVQALHNFSSLNKNIDLVGHIILNEDNIEVFNFGKYKGESVKKVFKQNQSYYEWMMKSDFPISTKKVITSIKQKN